MATYPLKGEGWTWYSVVMSLVIARYVSRWIQLRSIKKFQAEDYVMLIVAMLYTAEITFLVEMSGTPTNLFPPNQPYDPDNQADIQLRTYGSKLIVALEMVYCAGIWGCKVCLLLFYANLTFSLPVNYTWTKLCASYVVIGYIVMVSLYFGVWCQPFYNYWSVPAENPQCSTAEHHLILNCVLNISSDIMIMMIPLPLLIRTRLPLQKKLLLCMLFSLGLFVILSAVLNKYYSFTHPYGNDWVYWYTREISMAVIVANMPHIWALLRKIFHLQTFIAHQSSSGTTPSSPQKTPPSRFFDSADDPLSPKHLAKGPSHDGFDIDQVLADVERERVPMKPMRFRDMKDDVEWQGQPPEYDALPPSKSHHHPYKVPALSPLSPFSISSDTGKLLRSPSPAVSTIPSPTAPLSSKATMKSSGTLN